MKCFYHSADLDGMCSGAIVKYRYSNCELFPIDYGDKFPWDAIDPEETVFMVDFSLQPYEKMKKLNSLCNLVWIDHHKTAIEAAFEEYKHFLKHIPGVQISGIGACQIVWEYLFPGLPIPMAVRLLAEYDVWNHSDPMTLPFQYGMRTLETDPLAILGMGNWEMLFDETNIVDQTIGLGKTVMKYEEIENKKYCKAKSFEFAFEGLNFIACNKGLANSKLFDSVWNNKYDACMVFCFDGYKWKVSMYTTKPDIDVSAIAKKWGGGGHKGAAGFHLEDISSIMYWTR